MNNFIKNFFGYGFALILAGGAGVSAAFLITRGGSVLYHTTIGSLPAAVYEGTLQTRVLSENEAEPLSPSPPTSSPVRLLFVGDLMLDRGVAELTHTRANGDFHSLFTKVSLIKEVDLAFGNLEGPLSDKGADRHHLYSFRMSPEVLPAIQAAGFDLLSVANNHAGDWGREAFIDTLARLRLASIAPVGGGLTKEEAEQPVIIEEQGTTFGFLGFTDVGPDWLAADTATPGLLLASDPNLSQIIQAAKAKVDFLIVSYHFGEEYFAEPTTRQQKLAHQAVDAGANLVIGHHPHVVEPLEYYKNSLIAYSLGNFIFDQGFSQETMKGLALEVVVTEGKLDSFIQHEVKLSPRFQPQIEE